MSWLSNLLGLGDKQTNAMQQQLQLQQQQAYQQQVAEAERQRQAMAAAEFKRQSDITGGISAIDQAFAQFNDPFYQQAEKRYSDYYLPEIDRQSMLARNKATAGLVDRGMLESTEGANLLAEMEKARLDERTRVGNEAADFSQGIRNQVTGQRNSLYDIARSAADPSQLSAQATGAATTLARMPGSVTQRVSNLGDVFASMLDPLTMGAAAYQNRIGFTPKSPTLGSSIKYY